MTRSAKKKNRTAEAVLFFKEREVFETRALQTPPELHAIAPAAHLDGNRCKANPPTSAKKKNRAAEAVLFFKRERCSKLGRCEDRPSCTRLRLRHTLTAIAVRRIPRPPPSETDKNTLSVFFVLKHFYYFLLISLCLLSVFCSIVFVGVNGSEYCLIN